MLGEVDGHVEVSERKWITRVFALDRRVGGSGILEVKRASVASILRLRLTMTSALEPNPPPPCPAHDIV